MQSGSNKKEMSNNALNVTYLLNYMMDATISPVVSVNMSGAGCAWKNLRVTIISDKIYKMPTETLKMMNNNSSLITFLELWR